MILNHWSNTKIADVIRGTPKPVALPWDEWDVWNENARKAHPIRYWIVEELLDGIQKVLVWPREKMYAARYYINNRFISKNHVLSADPDNIKPGAWAEFDTRVLYCMFDEFSRFVENEAAWMYVAFDASLQKAYKVPRWRWWKRNSWKSRQAGLDWLKFQEQHAYDPMWAVEAQDLYHWWRDVRPNRADPYEASGWSELCRDKGWRKIHTHARKDECFARLEEIQARYEQEDTDNLIRLIRIRARLWT